MNKPSWVRQQEQINPTTEFWQFSFGPEETKTENRVAVLLPPQLIGLIEEYLRDHRPHLVCGPDPGTLS
jgi:hypothetical protein